MNVPLTPELFWLAATVTMTSLIWVPYILNRMMEQGIWTALYEPHGETSTKTPWAERMMRAHENAVENLLVFAPLVLLLHIQGINTSATINACAIFFFARLVHLTVFTFGIPLLRVISFLVGFACQFYLALVLFGVV